METQVSTHTNTEYPAIEKLNGKHVFICKRTLKHTIEFPVVLHILYLVEIY